MGRSVRSLALCFSLAGVSLAPDAVAQAAEPSAGSVTARFTEARKLFQGGDCASALPRFEALFNETKSPNALLYVARCQRMQGAWDLAYESFRHTAALADEQAAQDPKYEATRDAARAELEQAAGRVGLITVLVTNDGRVTQVRVGQRELSAEELGAPVAVMPGTVQVEASSPGAPPATREVAIAAGTTRTVALTLGTAGSTAGSAGPSTQQEHGSAALRTGGLVAAGVGVLGVATFATFGMLAKDRYESLDAQCDPRCAEDRQDEIDRGRMLQTTANVGLVVGALGLATGATLFALGWPSSSEGTVQVAVGPATASFRGSF